MDASSQQAVYERYAQVVKFAVTFQGYVMSHHFTSGLVARFPALVLHPVNSRQTALDKVNVLDVFPYGNTKDTNTAYVDMYVESLERSLMVVHKRPLKLDRFKDSDLDWRKFVNRLFDAAMAYAGAGQ